MFVSLGGGGQTDQDENGLVSKDQNRKIRIKKMNEYFVRPQF